MGLLLHIIEGPRKGEKFRIRPGVSIGRSGTDIQTKDPRVSSKHAEIIEDSGNLKLVDCNSSNGIWTAQGKLLELLLAPGVSFQLGDTLMLVEEEAALSPQRELAKALVSASQTLKNSGALCETIFPPINLEFIEGSQLGERWALGFGPRDIGATQPDLQILEPQAPELCFSLKQLDAGLQFSTEHPEQVKLNQLTKKTDFLKEGDIISISQTKIRVSFKT